MADQWRVPGVPFQLTPSPAELWRVDEGTGAVTMSAQPHTDLFIDPATGGSVNPATGGDADDPATGGSVNPATGGDADDPSASGSVDSSAGGSIDPAAGGDAGDTGTAPGVLLNAATLLGDAPGGDFQFSARVSVDFASTFDAGVLLLWRDDRRWGKLCFEFSPAGEPMIVSVVCRGVCDDANAFVVAGRSVWLRVSRIDRVYTYHASLDGTTWQLIRVFTLDGAASDDRIGFEGQSPTGEGCRVTFDEIRFLPERLTDLRDGS